MPLNEPYVLEIASKIFDNPDEDAARRIRAAAARNGVTDDQLTNAVAKVAALGLDRAGREEWVRLQYIQDGRAKGYAGAEADRLSIWALSQRAETFYRSTT